MAKVLNLQTYLEVLVILGRLKAGRRKGEFEEEINVAGHTAFGGLVVYYTRKWMTNLGLDADGLVYGIRSS